MKKRVIATRDAKLERMSFMEIGNGRLVVIVLERDYANFSLLVMRGVTVYLLQRKEGLCVTITY
ncbi:unnamed protein product [Thlaspi arvense]|uniref:Uncharacterized protein n=1 Tax=Thlaspi arvense TaxID=13288 RepID=A0AAU9SMX6_THLAR|nr:unnamed protein product [Thlaspi arvense]